MRTVSGGFPTRCDKRPLTLFKRSIQAQWRASVLRKFNSSNLINERAAALHELENHLYDYHIEGKRAKVSIVKDGGGFKEVDAIEHYGRLVTQLSVEIEREQKNQKFAVARGDVSTDEAVHLIEIFCASSSGVVKRVREMDRTG